MVHAAADAPPGGVEAPPGLQDDAAEAFPGADDVEAVREALLQQVNAKVAEKMEEVMREGRAMVLQAQRRDGERAEGLAAELEVCRARQSAMEAENEHLRLVITGIASRLSVLAMPFGPAAGLGLAPCTSPPGPDFAATPTAGGAAEAPALPEVPTFPFAASQPYLPDKAAAPPVSLAEALSSQPAHAPAGPGPTQLSLASSLAAGQPREGAAGRPDEFSFTLRRADGTELGLSVSQDGQALLIEAVRGDGAVDAWNKSCAGGSRPERVVGPGDRIVAVNGVTGDPERMLEECEAQQLLRLTVRRDGPPVAAAGGHEGWPTTMRADASEFVPMGAFMPPAAPGAVTGA